MTQDPAKLLASSFTPSTIDPDEYGVGETMALWMSKIQRALDSVPQSQARVIRQQQGDIQAVADGVAAVEQDMSQRDGQLIVEGFGLDLTSATTQRIGTAQGGPWSVTRVSIKVATVAGSITTQPRISITSNSGTVLETRTLYGTPTTTKHWKLTDGSVMAENVLSGKDVSLVVGTAAAGVTVLTVDVRVYGHPL